PFYLPRISSTALREMLWEGPDRRSPALKARIPWPVLEYIWTNNLYAVAGSD
ncbi:hypothetical protein HQ520_15135, partial [bacterium]|nr:hypothetical protein [bacterium]